MSHPPAEFPFWVNSSVHTALPWVTHSNKSSHRHAIHCGLVGLALALGGFLISLQHFFHTPNLFQLPLKTTLHAAHPHMCISTLVPKGVLCTIGMSVLSSVSSLHPTHTMCTVPIHEVPTYAHWPSSHPSMVGAPLCAHHTPPINLRQYSALHPHLCTCSEPGCTATFGHACPTMFPIAWRNFHHKPALVASVILWLEYLLCAHHLPSTSGNIPHCTCTRTPTPSPAALPHWDVPVHPCFPLPGGIFTTNQP